MKKIFLFAIATLFIGILVGQTVSSVEIIEEGSQANNKTKGILIRPSIEKIVGADATGCYVLAKKHTKVTKSQSNALYSLWIERYDKDMKLESSTELLIPTKGKELLTYENLIYLKGNLILMTSFYNKILNTTFLFAHQINKEGKVLPKFKTLDEIKDSDYKYLFDRTNARFSLSQDSSKLLLFHSSSYGTKEKPFFISKVFDSTLNLIWEKKLIFPGLQEKQAIDVPNSLIDNDGNLHILTSTHSSYSKRSYYSNNKNKRGSFNGKLPTNKITSYNYKTEKISTYEIKLPKDDKEITNVSLVINNEAKKIIVSGFFEEEKNASPSKGIFYTTIDNEKNEIKNPLLKEFDTKTLMEIISKNKITEKRFFFNFILNDLLLKKDGGIYIAAEKCYFNSGYTDGSQIFHRDNILVVKISSEGEIEWLNNIPKKTKALSLVSRAQPSYLLNFNKETDNLNLIFYDHPKNEIITTKSSSKPTPLSLLTQGNIFFVSIDKTGELSKKTLMKKEDVQRKGGINPKHFLGTGDNEIISSRKAPGGYTLLKFKFKY